jgi:hypothetical protein
MVVENINAEEEHDIDHPSAQRYFIRRDKEWRIRFIELRDVTCDSYKKELGECHQSS